MGMVHEQQRGRRHRNGMAVAMRTTAASLALIAGGGGGSSDTFATATTAATAEISSFRGNDGGRRESAGGQRKTAAAVAAADETKNSGRRLENNNNNNGNNNYASYYDENEYFEYDLSQYSLRFEKCQYVKMYDDELADDEENDSPLALKNFVVFKLCPTDTCSSYCDGSDGSGYGTYVADVETYLETTIETQRRSFENMCDNCSEMCNNDGGYCSGCGKLCYQYENLENLGYVDASELIECQRLEYMGDDDNNNNNNGDGDGEELYVGPKCSDSGTSIVIGLFYDENCWEPVTDGRTVDDELGATVSYHLLAHTFTSDGSVCLSCAEEDDRDEDGQQNNQNDQQDADDVNEMCEQIYDASAKCESKTGIANGFIQMNRDNDNENNQNNNYENQVENEFMSCTFIESLLWNSYTETGEINVGEPQDEIVRYVTTNQRGALVALSLTVVGLLVAMKYYERKINDLLPAPSFSIANSHVGSMT